MTRFKFRLGRVGDQHIHLQLGDEPSDNDLSIGYATAPWAKLLVDQAMEPKSRPDLWQHTSSTVILDRDANRGIDALAIQLTKWWRTNVADEDVSTELERLLDLLTDAVESAYPVQMAGPYDQDTQTGDGNS